MNKVTKIRNHYRCMACEFMISDTEMLFIFDQDIPCPRCGKQKLKEFQKVAEIVADEKGCAIKSERETKLEKQLAVAVDGIDRIINQNRTRGYPTGSDWDYLVLSAKKALKQIEDLKNA